MRTTCRASRSGWATPSRILHKEWRHHDDRIEQVSLAIQALAEDEGPCDRLMTMPGVAHIISTATVDAVGDGHTFERGRDFAAWLGLVPRQISTGDRTILGKISNRGNRYLRTLYSQAARVVMLRPQMWERRVASTRDELSRRGPRENAKEMEDRSSRRIMSLVTHLAFVVYLSIRPTAR